MPATLARDVTFLNLQPAVLCIECELISYNNTDQCLACGSRAVLSLARLLGGSLRGSPRTRLVEDAVIDRVASQVLCSSGLLNTEPELARTESISGDMPFRTGVFDRVVEHAYTLTGADGSALALAQSDGRMVCTAQLGSAAPPLGAEVGAGISALCVRTGRTLCSDDVAHDPRVDQSRCEELGIKSVVVAPLLHLETVVGVLTAMSANAYAFDERRVATVQALAGLSVLALQQQRTRMACLTGDTTSATTLTMSTSAAACPQTSARTSVCRFGGSA